MKKYILYKAVVLLVSSLLTGLPAVSQVQNSNQNETSFFNSSTILQKKIDPSRLTYYQFLYGDKEPNFEEFSELRKRHQSQTIEKLEEYFFEGESKADSFATTFSYILGDEEYILSLDEDQILDLLDMARSLKLVSNSWVEQNILTDLFSHLGEYKKPQSENDLDYKLHNVYMLFATALASGDDHLSRAILDRAFDNVETYCIQQFFNPNCGWSAILLAELTGIDESGYSIWGGPYYERRMKSLIRQMDYLKYEKTDYTLKGVKNKLGTENQTVLIQLFSQANSWFAAKDKDSFWKTLVTTGGLNPIGRAILDKYEVDENGERKESRFSETGETFYLSSPTPGTDGLGEYADSYNGRRHFILTYLVTGLFLSYYHAHSLEESSQLMQEFIREYIQLDAKGEKFAHYLYPALQGIRTASELHFASSLDGWEKEADALQQELYANIKKAYPWREVCTSVQGACEVAAEWSLFGKAFRFTGKGLAWVGRTTAESIIKRMSPRLLMNMALVELSAKQGQKWVMRWSRESFRNVLRRVGWKSTSSHKGRP